MLLTFGDPKETPRLDAAVLDVPMKLVKCLLLVVISPNSLSASDPCRSLTDFLRLTKLRSAELFALLT
jgi:hypothetical protein